MQRKDFFTALVVSDALATPLYGLSRGHITAIFKTLEGYVDPLPALKGHEERWRMPGVYSALSQLSFMAAMNATQRRFDPESFRGVIRNSKMSDEHPAGIFRHPDGVFFNYIDGFAKDMIEVSGRATVFLIPVAASMAAVTPSRSFNEKDYVKFISHVSYEPFTAAAALVCARCVFEAINNYTEITYEYVKDLFENYASEQSLSALYFDCGINPEKITDAFKSYAYILSRIQDMDDANAEMEIISYFNSETVSKVTRPTVAHPLAVLPFALYHALKSAKKDDRLLQRMASLGGATTSLVPVAAIFGACASGDFIGQTLKDTLVNKKKIFALIDDLEEDSIGAQSIQAFIESEFLLTLKESQDYKSKTKHMAKTEIDRPVRQMSTEERLSRHVVESWTKVDKARYKKEKQRQGSDQFEEDYGDY